MKLVSICIPTYEMKGLGVKFLRESFNILAGQTFKDFDVVISDHSQNDDIKNLCDEHRNKFEINYFKNTENRGSSSANLNHAIKHATGRLIKILFQDDFLSNEQSLEETVKNFDLEKDNWFVSACEHSRDGQTFERAFYPKYNSKIHLGKNTLSSPSTLTIKNETPLLFDENLLWLMDCDYYRRLYDKFGSPKILNTITVVNRVGAHQVTKVLATRKVRAREREYMLNKFGGGPGPLSLPQVTLVAVSSVKINETLSALTKSMRKVKYGKVIFLTDADVSTTLKDIEVIKIQKLDYDGYSRFVIYDLKDYIETPHALLVQHDGYVLHPRKWRDEFLNYDYIGAPWRPGLYFTDEGTNVRVGNGGFSLRSQKLLKAPTSLGIPFDDHGTKFFHEDGIICLFGRESLEQSSIKFAPVSVASHFSRERWCRDSAMFPFGFHSNRKNIFGFILKRLKKYL